MFGPDIENHRLGIILPKRDVDARLWCFAERLVVSGLDDADDLTELLLPGQLEALAERVLVGPVAAGHGVVDDRNRSSAFAIILGEFASREDRDTHRGEIIEVDRIYDARNCFRFLQLLLAFYCHASLSAAKQRQVCGP